MKFLGEEEKARTIQTVSEKNWTMGISSPEKT